MKTVTKFSEDKSFFKKEFLYKKYHYIKTVSMDDLEETMPKLAILKAEIELDYEEIQNLDLDFIVLPSVETSDVFDVYMIYSDRYTFTF